jgi:glycosyltransferase involved in cell wall biosynthesis
MLSSPPTGRALVFVVPARDEASRVAEAIAALRGLEPRLAPLGLRVLVYVVDDGSRDGTAAKAREAGADRIVRPDPHHGLGAAVRAGLEAARGSGADLVVKIDADLQHDPEDVPALLAPLLADEADLVYGDRGGRATYARPVVRRAGNVVFTWLMRTLTRWPVTDAQPGIFAMGRAYLARFHLPGDYNYTQQLLLDAYHKGMRFAQVPVTFRPRTSGRSFVGWSYPFRVLGLILMVLVGVRPLAVFTPLAFLFIAPAVALFGLELSAYLSGAADKPVEHVNLISGLGLFGLQTLFFGLLADLVVRTRR